MARAIHWQSSRTLAEFRLIPGFTSLEAAPENVSLRTRLVAERDESRAIHLNAPLLSAAMLAVSGSRMGIELARQGGVAVIPCSQGVEAQAAVIREIKDYKAGFVAPRMIAPQMTIGEVESLREQTGYSTFPVAGEDRGFLGLLTRCDYDPVVHRDLPVSERMIPRDSLETLTDVVDLKEANARLVEGHQSVLPVLDGEERLLYLVFRKDVQDHLHNPLQVVDEKKRLLSIGAINTRDYRDRVPALMEAEADALVVDASDGFSCHHRDALEWLRTTYPEVPVVGGNVITGEGFEFLVDAGACAVKVGMGSGSICITQEQKGTGRGLATAVLKVCEARDRILERTGEYIPVIADGGIVNARDVVIALALGADAAMLGRYFARMDESPTEKLQINNRVMKPYWGEGSARSRRWSPERYRHAAFAEGVEGFVEYAGKLADNVGMMLDKIKAALSACGCVTIADLHEKAELEVVSGLSIREGEVHDVYLPNETENPARRWMT